MSENPRDCWATPQWFVDMVGKPFGGFTVDACASAYNAKCKRYWTKEDNGLYQSWSGEKVWCNPPYSDIEPWVEKGIDALYLSDPALSVFCLPNRTASSWFKSALCRAHSIAFIKSPRLQFEPPPGVKATSARHDTLLLFFGNDNEQLGAPRIYTMTAEGQVLSGRRWK